MMKRLELLEREGGVMRTETATGEVATIIARINALRDQLYRNDLSLQEREEIIDLVANWRLRLAVLLRVSD